MSVLPSNIERMIDAAVASRVKALHNTPAPQPSFQEHADGLRKQIRSVQEEVVQAREAAQAEDQEILSELNAKLEALSQQVADLALRLDDYIERDRYNVTRAHVMRALKEAQDVR